MATLKQRGVFRRFFYFLIQQGVFVTLLCFVVGMPTAFASERIENFASELAKLRNDVQSLSTQIEDYEDESKSRLRSLRTRKADVDLEVQREDLRKSQLGQNLERLRKQFEAEDRLRETLKPKVVEGIGQLKAYIETSLPFKKAERLAQLDKMTSQMTEGLLNADKAAARLWEAYEDEMRLNRESGLYRQVIAVDGEEILTDVVRLGMLAMFYKTRDGRMGRVVRDGDAWKVEAFSAKEDLESVNVLFDAFKKNIRVGFFTVPAFVKAQVAK